MAEPDDVERPLASLTKRGKQPRSISVLNGWLTQAETQLGVPPQGGRLGWLVASTVVIAALQQAVDTSGRVLFLLKGGTLLQHRLGLGVRATKDVDGLVRGDIEAFIAALDDVLISGWGPFELRRSPVEVIRVPTRVLQPRRLDITVSLRGQTWRRVQVELAPDEAGAGEEAEAFAPPALHGFGLDDPGELLGLAMRFQIAQKLHACTDPHDPPTSVNDRARDLVDLLLLRDLVTTTGYPTLASIRGAADAVFEARAHDARELGRDARPWPPVVIAYPHWPNDYTTACASASVTVRLDDAVAQLNEWIGQIARAEG